jgi:hypothetical protein
VVLVEIVGDEDLGKLTEIFLVLANNLFAVVLVYSISEVFDCFGDDCIVFEILLRVKVLFLAS